MKIIKFAIIVIALVGLILTRPTKDEFIDWYVAKNYAEETEVVKYTVTQVVKAQTEQSDYLVFSVFEVDQKDRYIGVAGIFIGRSSVQDAADVVQDILEEASEADSNAK